MDRKNLASLAALALLGTAAAVGSALPATAARPSPAPPPPPAEAGCYDIVKGQSSPAYQRLIKSFTQQKLQDATPVTPEYYDKAVIAESDRGVVSGNFELGAVSCPEATYVFEVYKAQPNADGSFALLARTSTPGDGVRRFLPMDTVTRLYDAMTVRVQGYVLDSYGRVIDTGVDSAANAVVEAKDDGLPTPGGGSQFWG